MTESIIHWEAVLRVKEVDEGWASCMKEMLKAQKQVKAKEELGTTSLAQHKPLVGTKEKEERSQALEDGAGHSGGLLGCCEVMQREN